MSSYSDLIFAHANLVLYYRLGEASGTVADDVGPNNLDGTLAASGITYSVAGAIANDADTALTFDGSTDALTRADNNALDLGDGPFSIEFWVKRSATQSAVQQLVFKGTNSWDIRFTAANLLTFLKGGAAGDIAATAAITDQNWHHVVITKNGASTGIYVDGADARVSGSNQTLANTGTSLRIGWSSAGTPFRFPGSMDEFALYGAVLTAAEVLQHYRTGLGEVRLTDSVTPSEATSSAPEQAQADTATTSDATSLEPGKVVDDTVTVSDDQTAAPEATLSDTATVGDVLLTEEGNFVVIGDSVTVTDSDTEDIASALTQDIDDVVTVTDGLTTDSSQPTLEGGARWVSPRPLPRRHLFSLVDLVLLRDDYEYELAPDSDLQREEELILALL